jgi:hypothetical protein
MNRSINSLVFIGVLVCGAQAFADESPSRSTPTSDQMMKDCIEKWKATDVSMSKAEMKRICKDQMHQQKRTGALAEPPATDTPRN